MRLGHWCGTLGISVALSAVGLSACSGSTHELGHAEDNAGVGADGSQGATGGGGSSAGGG